MSYDLILSDRASDEYDKLIDYLSGEWGKAIALRIGIELRQKLLNIQQHPYHYQVFNKRKQIRRCVASPQTSIYYKIEFNHIQVLSIFDNRQSPRKLKL